MTDTTGAMGGERPIGGLFSGFGPGSTSSRSGRAFGAIRGKFKVDAAGVDALTKSFRALNKEMDGTIKRLRDIATHARTAGGAMHGVTGGGGVGGGGGGGYLPTAGSDGGGGGTSAGYLPTAGGGGGGSGALKAAGAVVAANMLSAGMNAASNRIDQLAAYGVTASQNNWSYRAMYPNMSAAELAKQRAAGSKIVGAGGTAGLNAVMDFQTRTGMLRSNNVGTNMQDLAALRGISGYNLTPNQALSVTESLASPNTVNNMYSRLGISIVKPGGQMGTTVGTFTEIINRLNWSPEKWQTARRAGTNAHAQLLQFGIPEDLIPLLADQAGLQQKWRDLAANDKKAAGMGGFTGSPQQLQMLGMSKENAYNYEKTITATGKRDERTWQDQADALNKMYDNTVKVTDALSGLEHALSPVLGFLTQMKPFIGAGGSILGSVTGGSGFGSMMLGGLLGRAGLGGAARGLLGRVFGGLGGGAGSGGAAAAGEGAAAAGGTSAAATAAAAAGGTLASTLLLAGDSGTASSKQAQENMAAITKKLDAASNDQILKAIEGKGKWGPYAPDSSKWKGITSEWYQGQLKSQASKRGIGDPVPGDGAKSAGSGSVTGDGLAGVHPTLANRIRAMQKENPKVKVSSGFRSTSEQEKIFKERYRRTDQNTGIWWDGSYWEHVSGPPAAYPGGSMHELGLAVDLGGDSSQYDWIVANSERFGLRNFKNLNGEPWHVQPIELPQTRAEYEKMGSPWGSGGQGASSGPSDSAGGSVTGGSSSGSMARSSTPGMGASYSPGMAESVYAGLGHIGASSLGSGGSTGASGGTVAAGVGGATVSGGSITGGQLTAEDVARVAYAAGFRGEALVRMVAIAKRESGYNSMAHNTNRGTGDNSYGLWQINMIDNLGVARAKQYGLSSYDQLFDPATNAKAAWQISGGGENFNPWTTNKGLSDSMMQEARAAVRSAGVGDGTFAGGGGGGTTVHLTFAPVFHSTFANATQVDADALVNRVAQQLERKANEILTRRR